MRCWCTGDELKEARVGLKKLNKPIRERATLSVGFIHKKTESTDQLRITKNPERPQKTIKVDDDRIFSMVKKTNFTRSNLKKRLKEVRVSLLAIKRRLHEYKYRRFTTRCKAQDKKTSYMIYVQVKSWPTLWEEVWFFVDRRLHGHFSRWARNIYLDGIELQHSMAWAFLTGKSKVWT